MKGSNQTVTQNVDPATQRYVDYMRRLAMGYTSPGGVPPGGGATGAGGGSGGPGFGLFGSSNPLAGGLTGLGLNALGFGRGGGSGQPSLGQPIPPQLPPEIAQAQQQYQNYAQGGNLGFSALTGNAGAAQQFMNPYLAMMNPFFAQQRQQAVEGANQQATLAGAFGGDRSQIGAATAGNYVDQNQAMAQIQAFNEAMQRALSAANLGYGASQRAAFLPQQYASGQLGLLQQALGPYGQTQVQPSQNDPFSQAAGLALLAAG